MSSSNFSFGFHRVLTGFRILSRTVVDGGSRDLVRGATSSVTLVMISHIYKGTYNPTGYIPP